MPSVSGSTPKVPSTNATQSAMMGKLDEPQFDRGWSDQHLHTARKPYTCNHKGCQNTQINPGEKYYGWWMPHGGYHGERPIGSRPPHRVHEYHRHDPIAKKSIDEMFAKGILVLQNANIPAAKTSVPAAKKTQPIKHIKANPTKERAYMKVQKGIVLMQKQMDPSTFKPISDNLIIKSFGSIPEFMKDISNRPTEAWWNRCFDRAQNFSEQPANYVGRIWYGDISKEAPWCEMDYDATKQTIEGEPNKEEDPDSEALKKWIPAALEGGGLSSLRQHPRAGNAIKNCAMHVGKAILGKSDGIIKSGIANIDPEQIGYAVLEALDEISNASGDEKLSKAWSNALGGLVSKQWQAIIPAVAGAVGDAAGELMETDESSRPFTPVQKAVAEPLKSNLAPQKRKERLGKEYDGESAVSGDGTKLNVEDLAGKSQTTKDY